VPSVGRLIIMIMFHNVLIMFAGSVADLTLGSNVGGQARSQRGGGHG
jgi:hypothetical protein